MASSTLPAINVQMPGMPESPMTKAVNGVLLLAAAGGSYFLIKKLLADAARNGVMDDISNPNSKEGMAANLAMQLYSGMITSEWANDTIGDGTNLTVVFAAAKDIHSNRALVGFDDVAKKYRALYQRDLLQDLQSDLNAEEMTRFRGILSTGLGALPAQGKKYIATVSPGIVLDQKLTPLQPVPANIALGSYLESMQVANGQVLHGFMYNGQMRYIDSATAKIKNHVSA